MKNKKDSVLPYWGDLRIRGNDERKILSILNKAGKLDKKTQDNFIYEASKFVATYENSRLKWKRTLSKDEIKQDIERFIKAMYILKGLDVATWDSIFRSMEFENKKSLEAGDISQEEKSKQHENKKIIMDVMSPHNMQKLYSFGKRSIKYLYEEEVKEFYQENGEIRKIPISSVPLYKERIAGAGIPDNADVFKNIMMKDLLYLWQRTFSPQGLPNISNIKNNQNYQIYLEFIKEIYILASLPHSKSTIIRHVSKAINEFYS